MVPAMGGSLTEPSEGDRADHDHGRHRAGSVPFGVVAIGLMVGVLAGVVLAAILHTPPQPTEPGAEVSGLEVGVSDPVAVDELVAAWERSRTETYRSVSRWHRVTPAGGEMARTRILVQRPPDRVLRAGGQVEGSVGGVRYLCDGLAEDEPEAQERFAPGCRAVEVPDVEEVYDETVAGEIDALWSYVGGDRPLYRVTRDGECFDLRLARGMFAPPYGDRARFCFDAETGAISLLRVERPEGTDTLELVSSTPEVTDDDLRDALVGE